MRRVAARFRCLNAFRAALLLFAAGCVVATEYGRGRTYAPTPLEDLDPSDRVLLRLQEPSQQAALSLQTGHSSEQDVQLPLTNNDYAFSSGTMQQLMNALGVMQSHYFEVWQGTWPAAIDWTAAVIGTQTSGALNAITRSSDYTPHDSQIGTISDNTLSGYFNQITSFYFGEDAFSLRSQAYDDMQWVVLGWLESIKFIGLHSNKHFHEKYGYNSTWHGKDFIPAFAHRARVFWGLAHKGWDTTLCGGGMFWSPYGTPYKNAITNQLYIAASVSMYLYFPGDANGFPFWAKNSKRGISEDLPYVKAHDPKYLDAAVAAYTWLAASNMTNSQGLYTDGFHISGWHGGDSPSNGTGKCDVRDESVYTYNQGVILTGQRGLWEATGLRTYLEDGHRLIRNVISATGFHDVDDENKHRWAGLGRDGVLEETCDASGACSQNGQTFKGIFFHHLTTFCAPLPVGYNGPVFHRADKDLANLHRQSCMEYTPWISRNAKAALGTRDREGRFGMWWTVGLRRPGEKLHENEYEIPQLQGSDYRNLGVPIDVIWRTAGEVRKLPGAGQIITTTEEQPWDPNSRGRGRTVETQSGGVAVLSALYRIMEAYESES